jgi:5-oxoprolinase (ATP-hydrolysing)
VSNECAERGALALHQVWCDVGGTFTDCFVVFPDGKQRSAKVLSNGVVKGTVTKWIDDHRFLDTSRCLEPNNFWNGSAITWLNKQGVALATQRIASFGSEHGIIQLEEPRPLNGFDSHEIVSYELLCGLEAPVLATKLLLGSRPWESLPPMQVRLGTTRGTNALLTRTGEPCALVTTKGFSDILRIGYQERPDLFALNVKKRIPLHHSVVEIEERLAADGSVLRPLDLDSAKAMLSELYKSGIRSIAICLLHAYCNPIHELAIQRAAMEIGFPCIRVSSQVAPKIKAVIRAETTLVDAYLTPVVQSYLRRVSEQFGMQGQLRIMTSAGGLVAADAYSGKDSVLSGPAGGAVAIEAYSKALKLPKCIGLDMGGTSTDVCRIEGKLQLENETIKAGVRMMVPTLAIHTVAAGGGSVCWFDGVQLRVGPKSAGANPGPACYGRGGPLTITDLNLLSHRIDPATFPFRLDHEAAKVRLSEVLESIRNTKDKTMQQMTSQELVSGFRRIANEHMAAAVRSISIAQGADPREHALLGFGGAAGQHLCEIADILGMHRIIDPPQAGLLSALGMGMASVKRSFASPIYQELQTLTQVSMDRILAELRERATDAFLAEGIELSLVTASFELELRYAGTEGALMVDMEPSSTNALEFHSLLRKRFEDKHRQRFGYLRKDKLIEVVSIQAEFCARPENHLQIDNTLAPPSPANNDCDKPAAGIKMRDDLMPGEIIAGPRLIISNGSTTAIEPGWIATVLSDRTLSIVRQTDHTITTFQQQQSKNTSSTNEQAQVDLVLREVLAQRIAAIADQMGIVLEQTAISVNVKDRRDFSCAVFAGNGDLIANAPHVPVHLGAMSETIRCLIGKFPEMLPGDCYVTNDPYQGGSHLPDITVVTPVFATAKAASTSPDFFVACRAHHAEIGGIAPGSMAPTSTRLGQEGVLIPPMKIASQGEDRSSEVEALLRSGRYPSRSVSENMADLAAQQAANQRGLQAMLELSDQYGLDTVIQYLEHIQAASESKTRAWIQSLESRIYRFQDQMDEGTKIAVSIYPARDPLERPMLKIDFEGTGPVSLGNLNANPAIVSAAVIYVLRCALADSLPLNSGVLRCVSITIPNGILNPNPSGRQDDWPAVAGGNVETSQRVVDCLLGALELAAASQGTMNNFLFGNASFGYYETIGGGTGATHDSDGEHAVHSHMTNTRLTDVEVLEKRYPVRLVQFEIRKGSGGAGRHRGGDGIVRKVQALVPLEVSLVTSMAAVVAN